MTVMKARGETLRALEAGAYLLRNRAVKLHYLTVEEITQNWEVFRRYNDKEWSFTDCSSKVVMDNLKITHAFAFDHHFRQFGTIIVEP